MFQYKNKTTFSIAFFASFVVLRFSGVDGSVYAVFFGARGYTTILVQKQSRENFGVEGKGRFFPNFCL